MEERGRRLDSTQPAIPSRSCGVQNRRAAQQTPPPPCFSHRNLPFSAHTGLPISPHTLFLVFHSPAQANNRSIHTLGPRCGLGAPSRTQTIMVVQILMRTSASCVPPPERVITSLLCPPLCCKSVSVACDMSCERVHTRAIMRVISTAGLLPPRTTFSL